MLDTCIVCCYFNPVGSRRRLWNFLRFYFALRRRKLPLAVIELTFPGRASVLGRWVRGNHELVRDGAVLWQKERLLNRLTSCLPERFTKIAWVDVDLLFDGDPSSWLEEVSALLDDRVVVQGFADVHRMARFAHLGAKVSTVDGFVKTWHASGRPERTSHYYARHGHTGYAWAARRSLFRECGLYDSCLSGSADHLMAHAFIGELDSPCLLKVFRQNERYLDSFLFWAERVNAVVGGATGYVDRPISHMWHGDPARRNYRVRDIELTDSGFAPDVHLELQARGTWDWSEAGRKYARWAEDYYSSRNEL